jgi:pyruvate formate lyase activating enzyme
MDGPLIVDIKRHSLEDGPGIRSVVFFKGCPLRCDFCQNPETQKRSLEIAFSASKCVLCGHCSDACSTGAIDLASEYRIRRDRCQRCGTCASRCPSSALRAVGTSYSPEALVEILLRDRNFYRHSGGGVTLSGGEATLHLEYLELVLGLLRGEGVHLALQTCGEFEYTAFRDRLLPLLDLIFFDVKLVDPDEHRTHTGRSNRRIIENLRRLLAEGSVWVRRALGSCPTTRLASPWQSPSAGNGRRLVARL